MQIAEVTCCEAIELVDTGAVLIDVREQEEWDLGYAPMAAHIPLGELPQRLDEIPRDALILCLCRSGGRSLRAAQFLAGLGFDTRNVAGGMLQWFDEGHPMDRDDAEDPFVE